MFEKGLYSYISSHVEASLFLWGKQDVYTGCVMSWGRLEIPFCFHSVREG